MFGNHAKIDSDIVATPAQRLRISRKKYELNDIIYLRKSFLSKRRGIEMNTMKKIIKKLFFSDLEKFSQSLGYSTWNELMDNSFHIFIIPPDAEWFATQLPNKNWAVWNDEGQPPFEYKEFVKWAEAIRYLRDIFEKNGYPEENWEPEGFEQNDDCYSQEPDKNKRIED
ncbi:hypothetical protein ACTFRD_22005 [Bacillus cereus group sp. MYBK249-1]|uniref:hypothetical protein n=2 Tax=Bacillus TaxID=1386 RepID=UPI001F0ED367|nr:hypothetical protein [Bacillus cereus]MDA2258321.1 hypothetical protein [Bacillus cereus]MDA2486536.1 hypothetical protein [Bacillus cereus]